MAKDAEDEASQRNAILDKEQMKPTNQGDVESDGRKAAEREKTESTRLVTTSSGDWRFAEESGVSPPCRTIIGALKRRRSSVPGNTSYQVLQRQVDTFCYPHAQCPQQNALVINSSSRHAYSTSGRRRFPVYAQIGFTSHFAKAARETIPSM